MYAHFPKGTKVNAYLDCWWYDHIDIVKDEQP
jgi:hypothetical protein